jgi:hypothetical protein
MFGPYGLERIKSGRSIAKGATPMETPHDSALQSKHAGLERRINEEMNRPAPDYVTIQGLKKRKLRIKEELAHS